MTKPAPAKSVRGQRDLFRPRVWAALRQTFPARFLIGVSGGPDSVALLHALVQLGYRPHVCHLNHQWRGKASDRDAEFVRALAEAYGLPVTIASRAVPHDEAAARRARLAFFESVGIRTLVLAHTADDQAETVLMRLIRGAGIEGLAGIWPDRQMGKLRVIRPLLGVGRGEVLKYLSAYGLKWREDASNLDRRFLRNRIRHVLLPVLEREFNPKIRDALRRTAEVCRAEIGREPVAAERRDVRALSFSQVEELRKISKTLERHSDPKAFAARSKWERFDAEALGNSYLFRTWRAGDRFQPLGMKHSKKLQDFFVDEKVPRELRARVPLLCAADGRIAWVVGYRIAEPFKVTAQTKRVLRIRFQGC